MVEKDWKLKLRYGKLTTPFKHFTVLAPGIAGELSDGYKCPPGNAYIAMKVWSLSDEQAAEMIQSIGIQIGFQVTGNIEIYDIDPKEAPEDEPFVYEINFTPFK